MMVRANELKARSSIPCADTSVLLKGSKKSQSATTRMAPIRARMRSISARGSADRNFFLVSELANNDGRANSNCIGENSRTTHNAPLLELNLKKEGEGSLKYSGEGLGAPAFRHHVPPCMMRFENRGGNSIRRTATGANAVTERFTAWRFAGLSGPSPIAASQFSPAPRKGVGGRHGLRLGCIADQILHEFLALMNQHTLQFP